MIDFPIAELLDDRIGRLWLARHLPPEELACPPCQSSERRLFRPPGDFPADRCRTCDGYSTLLTNTVLAKTRQRPATLVLLRRGLAKGEPTARLARELGLSRHQLHPRRQRLPANLHETAPTGMMTGTACEADERYQHAGANTPAASRRPRSAMSARPSAERARHLCD